ncbi:hypothetical protein Nocox_36795 [Nonomuraea coxensis DSM 45129]|uniref:Uncharacterized protein n=1 Tax=Nonomuraea coxensis DSM 45129 TaxID=1122611 RepID=A0ABX8UAW9_9ACTN|nr:hypothetical protein [Nonomuraea coxensis]QYC44913.1 hypothetical protein Nocox_36795 [Nonomuraea coxensis DSM 45129]
MARTRATAVSAIVLALGLAGVGATPFIVQSASASVALDPVEPCDAGDTTCQNDPQTTVTVTTTLGTPEPTDVPETTITRTVTATPTKKTTAPTKRPTTAPATTQAPEPPTQNVAPPTTQAEEPPVLPTASPTSEEPDVLVPSVAQDTPTTVPSETQVASSEEVPLELRAAAPEFDEKTLTQKLSIPALVLVLLALFAVLIFEGRLRRMAHAAAVRKAGPAAGYPPAGAPGYPPPPGGPGYPAGPGYASAGFAAPGYPGGTAYAPIISFVPVQTYASGPVQYAPMYQDPGHPYPPQGYEQEPPAAPPEPPPVVLHPDDYSHEPVQEAQEKDYRDPFEPLVPPAPPADIPPGGGAPVDDGHEHPLGPAAAAEPGDSEPWQQAPAGSLFQPAQPYDRPQEEQGQYDPPPYVPADGEATMVQPEPTRELPEEKRRRFRRHAKD